MHYYSTMTISTEDKIKRKAALLTLLFIGLFTATAFYLKWSVPEFEKTTFEPGVEVELTLPEVPEPEIPEDGGGGGGNPVQAAGPRGEAPEVKPAPGLPEDSDELEDDPKSEAPAITKPIVTKPQAVKVVNKSIEKTEPRPVETPAPPKPKAVMGKTTSGTGTGGGTTDDYERSGGSGTGAGVGTGSGTGGGRGSGTGGGAGSGSGGGTGPRVVRGDRKIVRSYSFEGDLDRAVIYANIQVSPEGIGKFISIAKGSSSTSSAYKQAIIEYLQHIRFDKADHESMVTVQFNFYVN
ncbi:MAG: hypothetical protein N2747_10845 [Chitinophagaceae bacterium]|nr:hypothetical protein [Chitinophagaceae bacterium]